MILIIISLVLGLLGFFIGGWLGGEFLAFVFGFIGMLSPALFILEKIYTSNKDNRQLKFNIDSTLNSLKSNGILTEKEYEKAYYNFNEAKEEIENTKKYDEGVNILYELSQRNIISEEEFNNKIRLLKTLYRKE